MNFIEAVKALKEGKCKGIKNQTLYGDRVYKLNGAGIFSYEDSAVFIGWQTILSEDWELDEPVVQYEEVEVVKMYSESTGKTYPCWVDCIPGDAIKLTGIMKREIKPKINCREEVKELYYDLNIRETPFQYRGKDVKFFAEWEE